MQTSTTAHINYNRRSFLARVQSLLRFFSAHSEFDDNDSMPSLPSLPSPHHGDGDDDQAIHHNGRDTNLPPRGDPGDRTQERRGLRRRSSLATQWSPTGTDHDHGHAIVTTLLPSADQLPSLPFDATGETQGDRCEPARQQPQSYQSPRCANSSTRSAKKFQRQPDQKQHDGRHHRHCRRSSVTYYQAAEDGADENKKVQPMTDKGEEGAKNREFRVDYNLGDAVRSPSDMLVESSPRHALQAVDSLRRHDCAFVHRTDGSYSYAILADRFVVPVKKHHVKVNDEEAATGMETEECMQFIMEARGATKMIRKKNWGKFIRLVSKPERKNKNDSSRKV